MNDHEQNAEEANSLWIVAEFQRRVGTGEQLSVDEFIAEDFGNREELRAQLEQADRGDSSDDEIAPTVVKSHMTEAPDIDTAIRGSAESATIIATQSSTDDDSQSGNEIPKEFGRYRIIKVLGQGAMGAVYLARDTQLDRDVALKIPKFSDGSGIEDKELLERFYREARASATLRSPNI